MAQITPVGKEQPKNHTVIAAGGAGLAVGALAGGGIEKMPLVPKEAKFTSVQQLVDAMTSQDKFEINLPESAAKEAKEAAEDFKTLVSNTNTSFSEDTIKQMVQMDPVLQGKDVVTLDEYLANQGIKQTPKIKKDVAKYIEHQKGVLEQYAKVGQIMEFGGTGQIQTKMLAIPLATETTDGSKELLKQLQRMGVVDSKAKTLPETINVTEELLAKYKGAQNAYDKFWAISANLEGFKDGKYTKEMLVENSKEFVNNAKKAYVNSDEAKTAFGKIQEYLPKVNNKLKGAMIWGAIGAVAAGAIAHFMTADKKSA